jgi:acyl-CoA reductase-like NAD-dependent aldehyde dehydrogenase
VGPGDSKSTEVGPVITSEARTRIESLIASAEQEGARIVVDGRGCVVPTHPDGAGSSCVGRGTAVGAFRAQCSPTCLLKEF